MSKFDMIFMIMTLILLIIKQKYLKQPNIVKPFGSSK